MQYLVEEETSLKHYQLQCGLAEARRMLVDGEFERLNIPQFVAEVRCRAGIPDSLAYQAFDVMEDSGELYCSKDGCVTPINVEEPDAAFLSNFKLNYVPVNVMGKQLPSVCSSAVNDERAKLTQSFVQYHLDEGALFFMESKNGERVQVQFTDAPVLGF